MTRSQKSRSQALIGLLATTGVLFWVSACAFSGYASAMKSEAPIVNSSTATK